MILLIGASTEKLRLWLYDGARNISKKEKVLAREMSSKILAEIKSFLTENGASWGDLSGLGVFSGPGSFTGIRIGLTVANTLADSLKTPIVGVSNSDFSKVDDGGDDWRDIAISKLKSGQNDIVARAEYGKSANITKQKK